MTEGVGGSIVVFAKCPIAGASKTRLAPLLGSEGAALLAKSMLSDILVSISACPLLSNTLKMLVYAPGTKSGESHMVSILQSLNLSHHKMDADHPKEERDQKRFGANKWVLLPMKSTSTKSNTDQQIPSQMDASTKSDLTSSSLGDKLEDALERTRELMITMTQSSSSTSINNEAVLFLGMDSPELPMEEIVYGLQIASGNDALEGKAHMCPANDGGYGLLSIPKHASSSKIFSSIRWSSPLTAVSQLKALTDAKVDVSIGRLMYDVDEPADVADLAARLVAQSRDDGNKNRRNSDDVLTKLSFGSSPVADSVNYPHHTLNALVDLNICKN